MVDERRGERREVESSTSCVQGAQPSRLLLPAYPSMFVSFRRALSLFLVSPSLRQQHPLGIPPLSPSSSPLESFPFALRSCYSTFIRGANLPDKPRYPLHFCTSLPPRSLFSRSLSIYGLTSGNPHGAPVTLLRRSQCPDYNIISRLCVRRV